jgi:hypothetical protein
VQLTVAVVPETQASPEPWVLKAMIVFETTAPEELRR